MKKMITIVMVAVMHLTYTAKAQNSVNTSEICEFNIPDATRKVLVEVTKDYSLYRLKNDVVNQKITQLLELNKTPENHHWIVDYWISILELNAKNFSGSQEHFTLSLNNFKKNPTDCAIAAFYALQSFIYEQRAMPVRNQPKQFNQFLELANNELRKGLMLKPQSPLLMNLAGVRKLMSINAEVEDLVAGSSLLVKAKEKMDIVLKQSPSYYIYSWNHESFSFTQIINRTLYPEKYFKNLSSFLIKKPSLELKNKKWKLLLEDEAEPYDSSIADGKSLSYYIDKKDKIIWFRLEMYKKLTAYPAVSVSLDTDFDQSTGVSWYGTNKSFKVDRMISVSPVLERLDEYTGYNGTTNGEGIKKYRWLNEKVNNITFLYDATDKTIFLGVKIADLNIKGDKIRVISSVGKNGLWNDDIGDDEYAVIDLKDPF